MRRLISVSYFVLGAEISIPGGGAMSEFERSEINERLQAFHAAHPEFTYRTPSQEMFSECRCCTGPGPKCVEFKPQSILETARLADSPRASANARRTP
jgi:hypothetical protein